ncbi:MAG: DNA repair exonuclease [Thermoplasmata archaeon]
MVKFSHIADCHLGAFGRNPTLREYNLKAFEKAVELSLERNVDFIIIAGDLFHNPHPDMDIVNRAVRALMEARKKGIRIYSVYGSHDFNISRASLVDVLESAEVFRKVVHYLEEEGSLAHVEDPSGVSIAGLSGRKNRMDASYYDELDFKEPEGDSIFVFHTSIAELKPVDIHEDRNVPLSSLPSGYKYYAGGHIHRKIEGEKDGVPVLYPSTTFGSSYTDLEKDINRGFYLVDDWVYEYVNVDVCNFIRIHVNGEARTSAEVEEELLKKSGETIDGDVVLLKVVGTLSEGVPEDIDFSEIRRRLEDNGAETVYLNRRNLEGKEVERISVRGEQEHEIEEKLIDEYGTPEDVTQEFAGELLGRLKEEQKDGETNTDYSNRVWNDVWELIQNMDKYEEEGGTNVEERGTKTKENNSSGKERKGQFSLSDFGGDAE